MRRRLGCPPKREVAIRNWRISRRNAERAYFVFFRFAAQYAFIRSACALRRAALWRLRFGAEGAVGTAFCGLPRRFAEPWRASMARFSLSRSAISRAMIWSVGIQFLRLSWRAGDCQGIGIFGSGLL